MKNFYDILKINSDSDDKQIKKAYREIIRKYHPDVNPSEEAKVRSQEINNAYSVLSNSNERNKYDIKLWIDEEIRLSRSRLEKFSKDELVTLLEKSQMSYSYNDTKENLINKIIDFQNKLETSNWITVLKLKEKYNKEQLIDICKLNNIEYTTSMDKNELIEKIKPHLLSINKKNSKQQNNSNDFYGDTDEEVGFINANINFNATNKNPWKKWIVIVSIVLLVIFIVSTIWFQLS